MYECMVVFMYEVRQRTRPKYTYVCMNGCMYAACARVCVCVRVCAYMYVCNQVQEEF